jgi:aminoglycoside 6'-N-acetyltransferase
VTDDPALDPAKLGFRPLTHADLPMLHRWLNEPHARPWFHGGPPLAHVVAEYSAYIDRREPIFAFVVSYGDRPIGMMNWQRAGDFPDFMQLYQIADPDAANCDVVIGDPGFVHRGLGPKMIRKFAREIIFADPRITTLIIDPERGNAIAIRAYEKAGFRFLRFIDDDGEGKPLELLQVDRADLG